MVTNFLTTQFLLCACTLKEYIEREFSVKGFLHSKKVTARVNVITQLQNKCWVRGSHCGIPIALEDFLSSFDNILQEDVFGLPHLTGRRTKTKVMRLPNVFRKCICVWPILHWAVIRACVALLENEKRFEENLPSTMRMVNSSNSGEKPENLMGPSIPWIKLSDMLPYIEEQDTSLLLLLQCPSQDRPSLRVQGKI